MDYNIPNMYIQLKELAQSSAEIPEIEERVGDLEDQVDGLDEQINGDSTAEPPVPGIVDELEAIETTLYGDPTADPPVEGLTDRVDDLELTINGDSTAVPPVAGLTDRVEDLEASAAGVEVASVTADGVKTYSQLLDELKAATANINIARGALLIDADFHRATFTQSRFESVTMYTALVIRTITINTTGSIYYLYTITTGGSITVEDRSSLVPTAGKVLKLVNY